MSAFAEYANYYDLLYHDKDYRAEAEYFLTKVRQFGRPNPSDLLEYGAGTGSHQRFLTEAGFSATGVELSAEMCEIGRVRGASLIEADITTYRHHKQVDAVLALFHVVSYITEENALAQMLSGVRDNLLPGGVFVFDVWFENAVLWQEPEVRIKRVSTPEIEVIRVAEPRMSRDEKKVRVDYSFFGRNRGESLWEGFSESHLLRYFSNEDLRRLAASSGFELLRIEETLTGLSPDNKSWGVTAVLRK